MARVIKNYIKDGRTDVWEDTSEDGRGNTRITTRLQGDEDVDIIAIDSVVMESGEFGMMWIRKAALTEHGFYARNLEQIEKLHKALTQHLEELNKTLGKE